MLNCGYSAELSHHVFIAAQVYPVGIPVLYAVILWQNRELLNPRTHTTPGGVDGTATIADTADGDATPSSSIRSVMSTGKAHVLPCSQEMQELAEKVNARREHPELVPSMFLWKDFGETDKGMRSTWKSLSADSLPFVLWGRENTIGGIER